MTEDEKFIAEFEACRWPLDQWHHRDHIKLAYLYLRRYPLAEAGARIRAGIQAHNRAHGIADTPTGGYHETMTQAWMRLVHFTLCEYGPAETADAFFEQSPHLSQKKALRFFYSPELFLSPQAKGEFVAPDLTAFPQSRKAPPL
ncbi:MAG TPA: hypothetical protein VHC95_13090 [Opitutales bacterium]|nr:hypothetical protein [Opitutales bacterium]